MKTFVALLVSVALASTSPLKRQPNTVRQYVPEENDPHRMKYLYFEDEQGKIHFEDLTKAPERKATEDDVQLYLFTRENVNDGIEIQVNALTDLISTPLYDPLKDNYFVIHGWNNDNTSNVNVLLKKAILETTDTNVFIVGWGALATKPYITARAGVPAIGEFVGDFINEMLDHYHISPKKFKLIGHSLGAHVAGCAGAKINGLVDYITGLDPASPLFTIGNTDERLDETDADFVQVVHTSSALLGFASSIGHADYFPNGGTKQPGCGLDPVGTCAHSRAYEYYYESIMEGGFNGPKCDSYKYFKKGECDDNPLSYIGSLEIDNSADGDYYLYTNKNSPFSME